MDEYQDRYKEKLIQTYKEFRKICEEKNFTIMPMEVPA